MVSHCPRACARGKASQGKGEQQASVQTLHSAGRAFGSALMGKYMRKRAGRPPAGVRTRSARSAASLASAAAAAAPKRPRKQAAARAEVADVGAGRGDGGCAAAAEAACYLRLRSRRLFMAEARCPAALLRPVGAPRSGGASEEPVAAVAGTSSSCSSTASSVDVVVAAAAWERSGGGAEEVGARTAQCRPGALLAT